MLILTTILLLHSLLEADTKPEPVVTSYSGYSTPTTLSQWIGYAK